MPEDNGELRCRQYNGGFGNCKAEGVEVVESERVQGAILFSEKLLGIAIEQLAQQMSRCRIWAPATRAI